MYLALRYAYLFDIAWFLLFTCVAVLLMAGLVLLPDLQWFGTHSRRALRRQGLRKSS